MFLTCDARVVGIHPRLRSSSSRSYDGNKTTHVHQLDGTKAQSDAASVIFPTRWVKGLYRTLRKKMSFSPYPLQPTGNNKEITLGPQLHHGVCEAHTTCKCNTPGFDYTWQCYQTISITLIVEKILISGNTSFVYKDIRDKQFRIIW
jgi:hypothetical protein